MSNAPALTPQSDSMIRAAAGAVAMIAMVDAAMVEMKNITPPLRRSECERLIRAALAAAPTPAAAYAPLTIDEARDLTCMLTGAPWPDEMLPELQRLLGIYDNLRANNQRPVDPATLPRKVAKAVMQTGGIRARVTDAISGALAFGAQGTNPPPAGHWLAPFWESAREETLRNAAPVSSDTLYLLRRLLSNQHTLTGSEFRAELEKIVGEAYQAADSVTAPAAGAVAGPEDDDSLMLCASDLEHSAIYDNHVEMQSCIRAVAARVRSLSAAPTPAAQGDA